MSSDSKNDAGGRRTHSLVGTGGVFSVRALKLEVVGTKTVYRSTSDVVQVGSHPRCDLVIDDPAVMMAFGGALAVLACVLAGGTPEPARASAEYSVGDGTSAMRMSDRR